MDNHLDGNPLRLSVYMTGPPAGFLRHLAASKALNMNQVVRIALQRWGRIEEMMPDPSDQLFVRKADGTELPVRFSL